MNAPSERQRQRLRTARWVALAAAAAVTALHLSNFMGAFRTTADDNYYLYQYLRGAVADWMEVAWRYAEETGRLGHLLAIPYAVVGSYWTEFAAGRLFIAALLAMYGVAAAWWMARFAGPRAAYFTALLFVVMAPVGMFQWTPNAFGYTMLLYVGLFAIRRWIVQTRRRWLAGALSGVWVLTAWAGFEYGLVLALSLVLFDQVADAARLSPMPWWERLKHMGRRRDVWRDWLTLAVMWGAFVGFRLLFPSHYPGNQIGDFDPKAILITQWKHLYSGLALKYYVLRPINGWAVAAGALAAVAAWYGAAWNFDKKRHRWWVAVGWGVFYAGALTFIIALTPKYREWCLEMGICAYLDSRLASVGVVAALAAGTAALTARLAWTRLPVAVLVGVASALTFDVNRRLVPGLREYNLPFESVRKYVALVGDDTAYDAAFIEGIMQNGVGFKWHPFYADDEPHFWRLYLADVRRRTPPSPPVLQPGQAYAAHAEGNRFLLYGWGLPLQGEVPLKAREGLILFPVGPKGVDSAAVRLHFRVRTPHPFPLIIRHGSAAIDTLWVAGDSTFSWTASVPAGRFISLTLQRADSLEAVSMVELEMHSSRARGHE